MCGTVGYQLPTFLNKRGQASVRSVAALVVDLLYNKCAQQVEVMEFALN